MVSRFRHTGSQMWSHARWGRCQANVAVHRLIDQHVAGGQEQDAFLASSLPQPGQIVQLDTVYVTLAPGKHIKHFTAYDPVAKWTVAKAYNRATAASAARFLDKLTADMPFKV